MSIFKKTTDERLAKQALQYLQGLAKLSKQAGWKWRGDGLYLPQFEDDTWIKHLTRYTSPHGDVHLWPHLIHAFKLSRLHLDNKDVIAHLNLADNLVFAVSLMQEKDAFKASLARFHLGVKEYHEETIRKSERYLDDAKQILQLPCDQFLNQIARTHDVCDFGKLDKLYRIGQRILKIACAGVKKDSWGNTKGKDLYFGRFESPILSRLANLRRELQPVHYPYVQSLYYEILIANQEIEIELYRELRSLPKQAKAYHQAVRVVDQKIEESF